MRIFVEITVEKWRPWMRKFNLMFSRADRKIEIVILEDGAFRWYSTGELYENDSNRH